jgi:hypothetical protein
MTIALFIAVLLLAGAVAVGIADVLWRMVPGVRQLPTRRPR